VRIFRTVVAVVWTLAIMTVCWLPRDLVKQVEGESSFFEIPNLDKVIHWGIFAAFSVFWLRVGERQRRNAWVWVGLAGIGLSALTEIIQNLPIIGRDGEMVDFLTDAVGVVLGLAVARMVEPLLRRAESMVFPGADG